MLNKPEVEVIKFTSEDTIRTSCNPDSQYCNPHCDPVSGTCTQCIEDCNGID